MENNNLTQCKILHPITNKQYDAYVVNKNSGKVLVKFLDQDNDFDLKDYQKDDKFVWSWINEEDVLN